MGGLSWWHWLIIIAVFIVLFGAKRLPDAARSLGRSLRIIKAETRGLAEDDVRGKADAQSGREPLTPEIPDDQPSPLNDPVQPGQRVRDN
jgi:sec-independent protein translocase protein TatA